MANGVGSPIIFFDSICVLCDGFVDFVLARDRSGQYRFAPLQGETAAAFRGGADDPFNTRESSAPDADPLRSMLLWENGVLYRKSDAALRVFAGLGGPWSLARPLLWIPRFIRNLVYGFIARNRYRWFGKRETCRLPAPDERDRFLP